MFKRFEQALLDISEIADSDLHLSEQQRLAELRQVTFTDKPLGWKVAHIKTMLNYPSLFMDGHLGYMLTAKCSDRSLQRDFRAFAIHAASDAEHRLESLHMYLNRCLDETKIFYVACSEKRTAKAAREVEKPGGPGHV